MSLNELMLDVQKPWLNARVNNLKVDSNINIQGKTRVNASPTVVNSNGDNGTVTISSSSCKWSQVGPLCLYQGTLTIASIAGVTTTGYLQIALPKQALQNFAQNGSALVTGASNLPLDGTKPFTLVSHIDGTLNANKLMILYDGKTITNNGYYPFENNASSITIDFAIVYMTNSD